MAVSTKAGYIEPDWAGGTVDVVLGFEPKFVLFWALTQDRQMRYSVGMSDGVSSYCQGIGNNNDGRSYSQSNAHVLISPVTYSEEGIVSDIDRAGVVFTSNGMTLTADNLVPSEYVPFRTQYLAIGGDGVETFLTFATMGAGTGTIQIPGGGFEPVLSFYMPTYSDIALNGTIIGPPIPDPEALPTPWYTFWLLHALGMATAIDQQGCAISGSGLAQITSEEGYADQVFAKQLSTTRVGMRLARAGTDDPSMSVVDEYAFVSHDADGVTLDRVVHGSSSDVVAILMVAGVGAKVGVFAEPSSAGSFEVETPFTPEALLLTTNEGPNTLTDSARRNFGACDGSTQWNFRLRSDHGTNSPDGNWDTGLEWAYGTQADVPPPFIGAFDFDSADPGVDSGGLPRIGRLYQNTRFYGGAFEPSDSTTQADDVGFGSFSTDNFALNFHFTGTAPTGYSRSDIQTLYLVLGEGSPVPPPAGDGCVNTLAAPVNLT